MAVCKFFQQGRCMFGDKCKNEHPQENAKQSGFGNQTWSAGSSSQSPPKPGSGIGILTIEGMTKDLTPGQEKPMWPLTSYGPGKFQPLLVGGLDESFEELRLRAVTAIKSGITDEYTKYEAEKIAAADGIYTNARMNVKQAYEQARQQFSDPEAKSDTSVFGQPSAFGNGSSTSVLGTNPAPTSAFGKSAFGQPAFGQSAFSQPTNPPATTSAFGQPSQPESTIVKPASGAFGSSGGGAFSAFAGSGASAFGSGSAPSGGGGFSAFASQPSAFGSGAAGNTTTAPSGGSVFGQSSFGSTPTITPSAFGTPAQGTTASAFGQPSAFGTQQPSTDSAFGGSPFSTPNPTGSVFGPGGSVSANANPTGSVFGPGGSASTSAPANAGSVFGPGGSAANSAFSNNSSSPFSSAQPISAFSTQPTPASSTPSAFSSQPSVLGLPPKPPPGPPDFANTRSPYKPDMDKYDAMLPENYMQLLPQAVKAAFESEKFVWGNVPEWIPPKELR